MNEEKRDKKNERKNGINRIRVSRSEMRKGRRSAGRSSSGRPAKSPDFSPATTSASKLRTKNMRRRFLRTSTTTDIKDDEALSKKLNRNIQVPPLKWDDIRVVPVCGTEWVGTNMNFVEFRDQIIVIDAGIGFADPSMPGVNYTIPNVSYLRENKDKIKALVITHGHLDHIGSIPYVIEDLGFPTIYVKEFGAVIIKKRLEEFPEIKDRVKIEIIAGDTGYIQLSQDFKVKFFGLTHSIPDSTGVIIMTPYGGIVSTGDVRVDHVDGVPTPEEEEKYAFFKDENILLLMMDSTNIEKPGWAIPESVVINEMDKIIKNVPGRLFIAAFSSQVERLLEYLKSAKKYGKYVAFDGMSMKLNMGVAELLELGDFSHVIPIDKIEEYPPNKIVVIATGSQGEQYAVLDRMAKGVHRYIKLRKTDTIVLSASVVPGNHHSVTKLKNNLYRGSYNIITYQDNMVHASGHGNREELMWIHRQIPYKFFMPIHGEPYMIRMHAHYVQDVLNVSPDRMIVPEDGVVVEIRNKGQEIVKTPHKIPHHIMVIDGLMKGALSQVVIDDRIKLGASGIFVVVVSVDVKTGKLKKSPDILSRGFVYLKESRNFIHSVRSLVRRTVGGYMVKNMGRVKFEDMKTLISKRVSDYIFKRTGKEPVVISVVLGV